MEVPEIVRQVRALKGANEKLHERIAELENQLKEAKREQKRIYYTEIDELSERTGLTRKEVASRVRDVTGLSLWESKRVLQRSHDTETETQVHVLHSLGIPPCEIDKKLGLKRGTAHDVIVDLWFSQKCEHMRKRYE